MKRVFGLSYSDDDRKARVTARFDLVGHPIHWVPGVPWTDKRLPEPSAAASIMLGHLDMIRTFLDGPAQYGIFCEDDILIRRDFNATLDLAISTYAQKGLDVLLLGYLTLKTFGPEFTFHPVTHDTWGAQMYLLNRQAATAIHAAFSNPREVTVFSADWTITKFGRAEFMYPMLAVEEGDSKAGHLDHLGYHAACHLANYDPRLHC